MARFSCLIMLLFQFVLLSAQNTGIGTTNPAEKLEVNGAIKIGNTTGVNPGTIRYNNGKFEGINDMSKWGVLGVPSNALIMVLDTTGILGQGYSIYGMQFVNLQFNLGPAPGSWQNHVEVPVSASFTDSKAVWTGSEILVYYNNFIFRLNPLANVWTQSVVNPVTGFLPRTGSSAVWTGTEMIIFGGHNNLVGLNDGVKYNPTTNTWAAIADAPVKRFNHSAILTNSEMFVFGGDSAVIQVTCEGEGSNEIWKYNISTNTWTGPIAASGNVPAPRSRHVSVWTGTEMLVFGGVVGENYCGTFRINRNETYAFNPTTNKWIQKSNGSSFRDIIGVWDGSKLRIWGSILNDGFPFPFGQAFDPVTNTWMPFPNENGSHVPPSSFAIWNGTGMFVVDNYGYQVFDPVFGVSNVYDFPSRTNLYLLRKN